MIQVGFFLLLCTGALAQIHGIGLCAGKVEGVRNFNETQYLGTWYEVQTYTREPAKCKYVKFMLDSDGKIEVVRGRVDPRSGSPITSNKGKLKFLGTPSESRWSIYFPGQPSEQYWILDTDYLNFAVIYACRDFPFFYTKYVWIYSRHRVLPAPFLEKAHEVLAKYELSTKPLKNANQQDCPIIYINV